MSLDIHSCAAGQKSGMIYFIVENKNMNLGSSREDGHDNNKDILYMTNTNFF